ncbi:MAG: hypothetical protein U9O85_00940 [Euryarchaeota archaeon]|nr:hypothetical protein [Euryarchaeota archaeon]
MADFGSSGTSREDMEEVVEKIEKKLIRSGIASTILGIIFSLTGMSVEYFVKADYGFILIAMGILGIVVGFTLWKH